MFVPLIVANAIVYFFFQDGGWEITSNTTGDWPVSDYALVPCDLTDQCAAGAVASDHIGPIPSVFTSMFMHGGLLHLGGNMLFLWIFGNNVEDSMGPVKFILFYLAGGIAADALQVAFDLDLDGCFEFLDDANRPRLAHAAALAVAVAAIVSLGRAGGRERLRAAWTQRPVRLQVAAAEVHRLAEDGLALVEALSEDAAVQIVERPSIGADPVLARAIAEAHRRLMGVRLRRGTRLVIASHNEGKVREITDLLALEIENVDLRHD